MAHIVVMGAGLGGMPAAYDLKAHFGNKHEVTLINPSEHFQFTPSNPWVVVGWRDQEQVLVPIRKHVERRGIKFIAKAVETIEPSANRLVLDDGEQVAYDYLIIATGPKLAFDEIPGTGPHANTHTPPVTSLLLRACCQHTSRRASS